MPKSPQQILNALRDEGWLRWGKKTREDGCTVYEASLPRPQGKVRYETYPQGQGKTDISVSFWPNKSKEDAILFGPAAQPSRYSQQWLTVPMSPCPPEDDEGRIQPFLKKCLETLIMDQTRRYRLASKVAGKWIDEAIENEGALRRHFGLDGDKKVTIPMINEELKPLKEKADKGNLSDKELKLFRRLNLAKNLINMNKEASNGSVKEVLRNLTRNTSWILDDNRVEKRVNRYRINPVEGDDLEMVQQAAMHAVGSLKSILQGKPVRARDPLRKILNSKRRDRLREILDDSLMPKIKNGAYMAISSVFMKDPDNKELEGMADKVRDFFD